MPASVSASLPVCLSACLPVCLSACLPVCLSACLPVCLKVNFHQDFVASMHSDVFQGAADRGQFYWLKHFGETLLSNKDEEHEAPISFSSKIPLS
jgi:hypothetical protein